MEIICICNRNYATTNVTIPLIIYIIFLMIIK